MGLFEEGTPGCQYTLTLRETEAFLMPQGSEVHADLIVV